NLLSALEQAGRERKQRPAGDLARIGDLLKADNESVRTAALRLAGLWQQEGLRGQVHEAARSTEVSDNVRQAALEGLVLLGGKASRDALDELAGGERPLAVRRQAVVALAAVDLEAAAARAVAVLAEDQKGADPSEVFNAFLQRKNGAAVLATA